MSFEVITPGKRWSYQGDTQRHFVALVGTEVREYHELEHGQPTVHVYVPDDLHEGRTESHGDPAAIVHPLLETTHQATHLVPDEHAPWVRALDDRELWEWLESAGYLP